MALSVDGVILLLNRGYEEISGFQRDALIGRDWIDTLLPSDAREQGRRIFHEIVAGQIPEFWESPLHASDGSVHTIKWHIGVVRDKSETISNIVFIGRDMTEERRLQEQVILSERLATVGRMAAQVAHEIRNPLSSIGLNIELLADEIHDQGLGNSGESRELIDNVLSQIERLNGVINDYLRFARMPVKHLKPECVNDLIRELAQFLQPETAAAHVRLTLNLCEAPPDIEIDRNLISQALLNCIRNAMEAMPEGGDLTLATGIKENHVEIGITDTGVGIAAEHLDRVFDPFFSTKDYGTGLGLPYVRQIVQEHRGEILIHSAPGKGAALTLRFPIAQPGSEEKDGS
jgi:PAS domain S-box-containing protein